MPEQTYDVVAFGVSAGGLAALSKLLPQLSNPFPVPILIVQHLLDEQDSYLPEYLNRICALETVDAQDKTIIEAGKIYLAPAGYHMMVDDPKTIALDFGQRVSYSRPSIDVLFESVADVYLKRTIGVILTGANTDGTKGVKQIKLLGGKTIAQDPSTAESPVMPQSAIDSGCIDEVLSLDEIASLINRLVAHE